jgi:hypothetical protein
LFVGRQQLLEWLVALQLGPDHYASDLLSEDPGEKAAALAWFHESVLPEGVGGSVYEVHQTLVTVHVTY